MLVVVIQYNKNLPSRSSIASLTPDSNFSSSSSPSLSSMVEIISQTLGTYRFITGEGEARNLSCPDISIDLFFFPQAAVRAALVDQQTVVVRTVDVVEDDDTKNNLPFRLQSKIIFIIEIEVFS